MTPQDFTPRNHSSWSKHACAGGMITEDPTVTLGVIEAGEQHTDADGVTLPVYTHLIAGRRIHFSNELAAHIQATVYGLGPGDGGLFIFLYIRGNTTRFRPSFGRPCRVTGSRTGPRGVRSALS
ncbi:hypothetical protein L227DRAFT_142676 [Lentinus tigrinus ALCF2SS1-6]|uniref:Uncharacterized protein n=1 Tax=Lentinus tigrinus ALCF2SS1-6 TaxID=1328759 RepID=A0A5C2SR75_9APHY|nr:hypothetical protein L227DRAFT_142676 [Lentinus tigrinus ALCF2SS1-6]